MANLSITQMYGLARKAGFSTQAATTAAAVGQAESGGNPDAVSSNPDGGTNVGLMQLDTPGGKGAGYTVAQLKDPLVNMQVAFRGSAGGTDWSAWQTYTQATFTKYTPEAQTAAAKEAGGIPWGDLIGNLPFIGGAVKGVTSGIKGVEEVGAVAKAFYALVTDGKMWRSLGWLGLGIGLLFWGVAFWLKLPQKGFKIAESALAAAAVVPK
jgi:lysozyme-like protein